MTENTIAKGAALVLEIGKAISDDIDAMPPTTFTR
jgi:hypothetical protein